MKNTADNATYLPGVRWSRRTQLLVLVVPLVCVFLLGELAGRLLEQYAGYMPRRSASYAEGNPYLRSALIPGIRFKSGPFSVDVNRLGFRGPEIKMPKPPGTFRIFALGENQIFDLARKLLGRIKNGELAQGFTQRIVMRKKWSGFRVADDVNEVLSLLIDYGYLKPLKTTEGRPTTRFFFHSSLECVVKNEDELEN